MGLPQFLQSSLLSQISGVTHGFGTRREPVPHFLEDEWSRRKPLWKQTHGTGVAQVLRSGQSCGEVDALWSDSGQSWVGVVTADCLPVLMAARDGSAVMAIHAGWRGCLARILEKTWNCLRAAGQNPGDWVAAIGPCIQPCCFEVAEELQETFISEFSLSGEVPRSELNPRFRHLDLPCLSEKLLQKIGVSEIEVLRHCTRCSTDAQGTPLFHSYRREGGGTRQFSLIGMVSSR